MTKKDYELIASILYASKPEAGTTDYVNWARLLAKFVGTFKRNNPKFNSSIFLYKAVIKG